MPTPNAISNAVAATAPKSPNTDFQSPMGIISGIVNKKNSGDPPLPTLDNFKKWKSDTTQNGNYSEDVDPSLITRALDKSYPVQAQLNDLKNKSTTERAEIGAKFGAGMGLSITGGPEGAVAGAAIGSMASRGLGQLQSGEQENSLRRSKVLNVFKMLGISDDTGNVSFDDGHKFLLHDDPSLRLRNLNSAILGGTKDRAIYQMDSSHPMTQRTVNVARPLARYITNGLLKYMDESNSRDSSATDATTGLLVNALQDNAKTIDQVYDRAKGIASKLNVSGDQMRSFFDKMKLKIKDSEATSIKKGLDILYGS